MPLLAFARRRGFTLVELLVVLAILAIVAGLLAPVFAMARRSSLAASCLTNFRGATQATMLYVADYDDRLMPMNQRPGLSPDPVEDRVWPQLLLPYARDFRTFECPADPRGMAFGSSFDADLLPGDYLARYYEAALHSDLGYNAYYLAPILNEGSGWVARPKAITEVEKPSNTLLFVESQGAGGGSYLVSPPCRYVAAGNGLADSFLAARKIVSDSMYTPIAGWDLSEAASQDDFPYGGVSARHGDRLNVSRVDGSARSTTIGLLEAGCDVQSRWLGAINDPARYAWFAE